MGEAEIVAKVFNELRKELEETEICDDYGETKGWNIRARDLDKLEERLTREAN